MKKVTKSIITSSLLALAFGAMSVGTTFALFTSKAETTINVESGVIDLKAPISVVSAWELGNVQMVGSGFSYQNSIGGSITKDENNIVHLNKLAPGDGALFALTPNNSGTNIKTKARLVVTLEGDLAGALNVEVKAGEDMVIGFNGAHTGYTPWQEVEVGGNPTAFNVKVEFPDGDNGEILFGEDNHDNQYQNKTATLVIGYEAVQGNAQTDDMLQVINTKLMTEAYLHGENETMYDALQDLSSAQVAAIETRSYVWSVEADQFFKFDAAPAQAYKYFKMYGEMPDAQTYSIYATGTGWTTVGLTGVGFDAGSVSGITSVSYVGASDARANIIRTNSATTAVNVDAPQDTISHYGTAGSLNINAIAGNSYHEHGKVAFVEIKTGRMALEKTAEVEHIHLATSEVQQEAVFNNITISKAKDVEMPDFSRDPVTIPAEGRLVVALQEGTEDITAQTELDYVWLTAVGIYEQVTVSESNTEAGNNYAVNSTNQEKKDTAQQIANNITANVGGDEYTLAATTTDGGETWTYTLESGSSADDITENVTVTVEENVATVSVGEDEKTTKTENGISSEEKEEVKGKLTCVHNPYPYVVEYNYWEYNNNEYEFFEKRVCSNCGTSYVHKHDLVGMYCNECKHMVPLVVDTLDLASGKVKDQTILNMANQFGEIDFNVVNLIDGVINVTYDTDTISINDLNYLACFDTGRLVGLIGNENEFVDNNDGTYSYSENGNLSADDIARSFNDYTVDFTLEFNVDMDLRAIGLAGYYDNYAFAIKPSFTTEANNLVKANTEIPVMGSVGWPISYSYLENVQFLCGLMINGDNMAQYTPETLENLANAKVTLRLEMYNGSRDNRVVVNTLVVPLSTII